MAPAAACFLSSCWVPVNLEQVREGRIRENTLSKPNGIRGVFSHSDVVEQRHKPEIHMELLMTVKQGQTRIVGYEVDLSFLVTSQHHHIFHDASSGLSCELRQLKTVPVEMDRMNVVAGVAHSEPIPLPLFQVK